MMVETMLESSQDFAMSAGGVPQWKRELLQRRGRRARPPPPAPPPPPPAPPARPDDDEELRYGPGIVKRLQSRYLSLALRDAPARRPSLLRRAASLEHLLDEPPLRPAPPAMRPPALAPERRDSIKRARSVDALSRLERRPAEPAAGATASAPAAMPRAARPPRRPQPLLREAERPPPDLVRAALRKFEVSSGTGSARRAPAARVAAVLRELEDRGPRSSTPEPRARSPSPAGAELSAVEGSPRIVPRAALEGIARAGSCTRYAFPAARPGEHLPAGTRRVGVIRPLPPAAPPPPPRDLLLLKRAPSSDAPDRREPPSAHVEALSRSPVPDPLLDVVTQERKVNSPEMIIIIEPKVSSSPEPVIMDPIEPVKMEPIQPIKVEPSQHVKTELSQPVKLELTQPVKTEFTHSVKTESTQPPVKMDLTQPVKIEMTQMVKMELIQKVEPLMNGHKEPEVIDKLETAKKPVPVEEQKVNGKVSRVSVAKIECGWHSGGGKEPSATGAWPRGGGSARRAPPAATSVVFNFSARKEVPDYIENDGIILRASRRDKLKAGDPGVVVLRPQRADTDSDSEPEGEPAPCEVRFVNDNVLINGKSSMLARPNTHRVGKLKLQFDDSLTRTFEYPSETSLCEDGDLPATNGTDGTNGISGTNGTDATAPLACLASHGATLLANTHIASAALSTYTPSKTRADDFRLGLTRRAPPDADPPVPETASPAPEDAAEPAAEAARSWSESRAHRTDLLF